ncbi:MAG TPA: MerC domain-containing protein [Chitinophagaceae bacterium]|nr:MerC domain-containing protein [Chitinophagaceae bacterium]
MKSKINWDAVGIAASVACAIHCAVLPLFLSSLPLFGMNVINNKMFEALMISAAFGIGSYSLYHGFRRHHHRSFPLVVFSLGFICLVLKEFYVRYETWLLFPAVVFIVSAHFLNYRYCRLANHCHADDCDH